MNNRDASTGRNGVGAWAGLASALPAPGAQAASIAQKSNKRGDGIDRNPVAGSGRIDAAEFLTECRLAPRMVKLQMLPFAALFIEMANGAARDTAQQERMGGIFEQFRFCRSIDPRV